MEELFSQFAKDDFEIVYTVSDRSVAITKDRVIKISKNRNLVKHEFEILQHLEKMNFNYSPKPIAYGEIKEYSYIIKSYIPGATLKDKILVLSNKQIQVIKSQLKNILNEIHTLDFTNICDKLDKSEYIRETISYIQKNIPENILKDISLDTIEKIMEKDEVVFIHGDFHPRNIIVGECGQIVGIIDWEFANYALVLTVFFMCIRDNIMEEICIFDEHVHTIRHLLFRIVYKEIDTAIRILKLVKKTIVN